MENKIIDLQINSTRLCDIFDTSVVVATFGDLPEYGEGGNRYLCSDTGNVYRWYGNTYVNVAGMTEQQLTNYSIANKMYPTEVALTSETYSRDANRTANYEMVNLTLINRKTKPEFTWSLIKASYVENLLALLSYAYNFVTVEEGETIVTPQESPALTIAYRDFVGLRTINAYLGQTIEGTLVAYDGELYWEGFRIAFPER